MRYLSSEDILLIHSLVIDETGGSHGVRDLGAIESAVAAPRHSFGGAELYPTIHEKAAVCARTILMNHPFIDGNKRTGMTAASIFLEDNGYPLTAAEGGLETFALRIVRDRLDIAEIAAWFKKYSRKYRK